jgi:hypothetical protein
MVPEKVMHNSCMGPAWRISCPQERELGQDDILEVATTQQAVIVNETKVREVVVVACACMAVVVLAEHVLGSRVGPTSH